MYAETNPSYSAPSRGVHLLSFFLSCMLCCTITYSLIQLLIYSLIHLFTHSLIHSFTHSLIHWFTHSLIHSLTHSFTHSLIHLFTYSFEQRVKQIVYESWLLLFQKSHIVCINLAHPKEPRTSENRLFGLISQKTNVVFSCKNFAKFLSKRRNELLVHRSSSGRYVWSQDSSECSRNYTLFYILRI